MNRQIWYIGRPLRDPAYHPDALMDLKKATNNFTVTWKGNKKAQLDYETFLAEDHMKRNSRSASGSGGRTWASMLRNFNYVYLTSDEKLKPTKVGREILQGNNVFENVKKQILTFQIPNSYFLSSSFQVKFDECYQIQPIIFLIKLANSEKLNNFITKDEIVLFAMTAKKDNELNQKIIDILKYRKSNAAERKAIESEILLSVADVSRLDSRKAMSKYRDVATTFTKLITYTGYATYDKGKLIGDIRDIKTETEFSNFCNKYPFNYRIFSDPLYYSLNAGLDINTHKAQGGNNIKVASSFLKKQAKVTRLLNTIPFPENLSHQELTRIFSKEFPEKDALQIAGDIIDGKFKTSSDIFLQKYLNEKNSQEFEKETQLILRELGITTYFHPKPTNSLNGTNENIDILGEVQKDLILIDAKNYKNEFRLSANFRNIMANSYISGYMGFNGHNPRYYCYVTANKIKGTDNLKKINAFALNQNKIKVSGMMISASSLYWLLQYFVENHIPKVMRAQKFLQLFTNISYDNFVEVAQALNLNIDD